MPKKYIPLYLLALLNFVCAIFHAVFQLDLLASEGIYREFLLTENMVITFVFIYFAVVICCGKAEDKQKIAKMNIFFWFSFLIFVGLIQPTTTTLSIVKNYLIFPQSYYLFFLGSISLILSLLSYQYLKYCFDNNQPT
jgi:hypothetical protein